MSAFQIGSKVIVIADTQTDRSCVRTVWPIPRTARAQAPRWQFSATITSPVKPPGRSMMRSTKVLSARIFGDPLVPPLDVRLDDHDIIGADKFFNPAHQLDCFFNILSRRTVDGPVKAAGCTLGLPFGCQALRPDIMPKSHCHNSRSNFFYKLASIFHY